MVHRTRLHAKVFYCQPSLHIPYKMFLGFSLLHRFSIFNKNKNAQCKSK